MNYVEEVEKILSSKIIVNKHLMNLYVLLVLTKGVDVTLKDVHDAWAIDKNMKFKEHRSLKPFYELDYEVQIKDLKHANAIKETAREYERLC